MVLTVMQRGAASALDRGPTQQGPDDHTHTESLQKDVWPRATDKRALLQLRHSCLPRLRKLNLFSDWEFRLEEFETSYCSQSICLGALGCVSVTRT